MEYVKIGFVTLTFVLSLVALGMSVGNMKRDKFKIQRDHIERLLGWHFLCVQNMIRLRQMYKKPGAENNDDVTRLLSELSALIDQGRFFFPNIDRDNKHGADKPLAYRGYRHGALSLLVATYDMFHQVEPKAVDPKAVDPKTDVERAKLLQRGFTSMVYGIIRANRVTEKLNQMAGGFSIREITYANLLKLDLERLKQVLRHSGDRE